MRNLLQHKKHLFISNNIQSFKFFLSQRHRLKYML